MELEDYVEKLQKQKKVEKKQRKKKVQDEKIENRDQRKRLMKFTSSQKWKLSAVGKKHMWKVYKERMKNYYNYPRGVVYLSCIPHGFFEEQMASYFNQFGKVTGIYMPRSSSGKIKGYAFIEFQLEVIAKIVAETMNNYLFYQRILKAKYIPPADQKPYMFVFPFGDKMRKSVRIPAEIKKRKQALSALDEDAYKQKLAKHMEKVKNKMAALGGDYVIQVSGEAPPPSPPTPTSPSTTDKTAATQKKLKQIKAELGGGTPLTPTPEATSIDSILDKKLTKQILKNISRKLAKPLGKKKKTKEDQESSDNEEFDSAASGDDDFETADENSFDFDDDMNGLDDESDEDDGGESPAKKAKLDSSKSKTGKSPKLVAASPKQGGSKQKGASPKVEASPKPGKQQKTPVKQQKTPTKQQTTPANQQKTLAKQKTTPANQQKTPKQQKTPNQQKTPAKQQTTPANQQKTPKQQKSPANQQKSPAIQQKTPANTPQGKREKPTKQTPLSTTPAQSTPAQVKSNKKKSAKKSQPEVTPVPANAAFSPLVKTPGKVKKQLLNTPDGPGKSAKKGNNKPAPVETPKQNVKSGASPKLSAVKKSGQKKLAILQKSEVATAQQTPKSAKKLAILQNTETVTGKSQTPKSVKKSAAAGAQKSGKVQETVVMGLKRKSVSDAKKGKLVSVEKKRKSLPK